MNSDMILILGCVFGAVTMLGLVLGRAITGAGTDTRLRTRLTANPNPDVPGEQEQQTSGMVEMVQRVGQDLLIAHPGISRELAITYMETRVGLSRGDALKNLGTRTGSAPLQSLSSMLQQADRFGTSIANALRIHADTLRQQRQH